MVQPVKKFFLHAACALLFLFSCNRTPVLPPAECSVSNDIELKNSLVGMWKSDALVVGIDTILNSELSVILEVKQDKWTEKLKMQPIQTIFNKNQTYISAYIGTDGKVIKMTAGKWVVQKNQLTIHQLFPVDKQMNYRVELTAGALELRSKLDFDSDGKDDDLFYCQMKKIS